MARLGRPSKINFKKRGVAGGLYTKVEGLGEGPAQGYGHATLIDHVYLKLVEVQVLWG